MQMIDLHSKYHVRSSPSKICSHIMFGGWSLHVWIHFLVKRSILVVRLGSLWQHRIHAYPRESWQIDQLACRIATSKPWSSAASSGLVYRQWTHSGAMDYTDSVDGIWVAAMSLPFAVCFCQASPLWLSHILGVVAVDPRCFLDHLDLHWPPANPAWGNSLSGYLTFMDRRPSRSPTLSNVEGWYRWSSPSKLAYNRQLERRRERRRQAKRQPLTTTLNCCE